MTNSQPKYAVKTAERAKEILFEKGAHKIERDTGRCECGETDSFVGLDKDYQMLGYVLACDSCGDDDWWTDELFNE